MQSLSAPARGWHIELEAKPDFDEAVQRIYAWYEQQVIDRPPVRFSRHNAEYEATDSVWRPAWRGLRDKWLDEEYQVERFMSQVSTTRYLGETFPVFWPNLGPHVFAALYGCPLEFGDVTSWAMPILNDYGQTVSLDWSHPYLAKLESLTRSRPRAGGWQVHRGLHRPASRPGLGGSPARH